MFPMLNFRIIGACVRVRCKLQIRQWYDVNWISKIEEGLLLGFRVAIRKEMLLWDLVSVTVSLADFGNGSVRNRPRSGRPRSTTNREDRYITNMALRQRTTTARRLRDNLRTATGTRVSDQTIRNRLRANNLRCRRQAVRPPLLPRHRTARRHWCTLHLRWERVQWGRVMFTDESRFSIQFNDGRVRVYRRPGERFADVNDRQRHRFGGGSVMGRRIDPSWGGPIELFLVPASAPRHLNPPQDPHLWWMGIWQESAISMSMCICMCVVMCVVVVCVVVVCCGCVCCGCVCVVVVCVLWLCVCCGCVCVVVVCVCVWLCVGVCVCVVVCVWLCVVVCVCVCVCVCVIAVLQI